ncbi:ABC transporter substrate-binding protein [Candidatus Nitrospira inopinata]|jgi:multiple sugar transport system substrate-binding protein|uniref:Putative ABC-type sugar transport system, periplasmic binding component n=1 Tax=Candidatus Nitrospira inopinata TaxID=1715989 RepID=A0A0S4KTB8_9BACT|nr:ABC transporter substrate-binding protein [Candidatus Nitrospira inopinata]CUQ67713.1 putative ABC-type sugar transport system, periplasmic binding component [Candidatus Nitrospira inopinata]
MTRAWILLSLVSILGCTQRDDASRAASTVLIFKHGRLSGDERTLSGLLREFERRHPGVTVREEVLPSSSDQQHQYYTMSLDGGRAPFDVLSLDVIWVQEFAKAGWIAPLDDLPPTIRREDFFPGPIEAATRDGGLYAVPWYIDAGVLYYRKDLLERYALDPPRTWPELLRAARLVLDAERDPKLAGFVWQGKQYEGLVCVALEVLRSNGSDLWVGDRDRAEEGLQLLRDLVWTHKITPLSIGMADEDSTRLLFGEGRALFMRNWPYAWSLLQREGSPVRGKVGIAPVPAFSGFPGVSVLGGWLLAVAKHSPHQKEARDLVGFLTSPDVQRRMAMELGYNPTRIALYAEQTLSDAKPIFKDLFPIFLSARPRPITPYYLLLSQAAQPELSALVVGTKEPRDVLRTVRRQRDWLLPRLATASTEREP